MPHTLEEAAQGHYPTILRWVHTYKLPPKKFEPATASNRELAQYGLPERPDRIADPDLFAFWERLLGPPIEFLVPEFPGTRYVFLRQAVERRQRSASRLGLRFEHRESSRNWSGAYITPPRAERFVYVAAAWNVPSPREPRVSPADVDCQNVQFRSSTWIGIGGHRPYNSLPQIGTGQHLLVTGGVSTTEAIAWWQWWVDGREEHHVPMPILNMPVRPGDEILASLTVEAPGDAHFHFKNHTTGTFVTFKVVAPAEIEPLGSTAEWIHERPTKFASSEIYPLPNCTDVVFKHCLARSTPRLGETETTQRLDNPRLVRMHEIFEQPHRTAFVSIPERIGRTGLRIAYREAGS